jgi:hypothetical protein
MRVRAVDKFAEDALIGLPSQICPGWKATELYRFPHLDALSTSPSPRALPQTHEPSAERPVPWGIAFRTTWMHVSKDSKMHAPRATRSARARHFPYVGAPWEERV